MSLYEAGIIVGALTGIYLSLTLISFKLLERKIGSTIEFLIENLFKEPSVKHAMSVIGKEGGKVRTADAAMNKAAQQILSGPKMSGVKMALGALGINLDSMIEEYGAIGALTGLSQLGSMIGLDVEKLLSGGLGSILGGSDGGAKSSPNPFLIQS